MIGLALLASLALTPPEYLGDIAGDPVVATGTADEIAARGRVCIAQQLGSGAAGGDLIISDSNGVIVARSTSSYRDGLVQWNIRSRLTFEAREGRFRITQASPERFNEMGGGWGPIGKWRGSGWQKAEDAFKATASAVTECVAAAPAADW